MGRKRLAINLAANIISYSTTVLVAFFLTPYLVRTLGKDAYGFYPLANNFVSGISIITLALNSMASRFISIEIIKGNKEKANTYFASVFFSNVAISIILLIPMTLLVIFLDSLLNIPLELVSSIKILFALVFLSMLISIISSVLGVATFAMNRIDWRSYVEIIQAVFRVILYIVLFTLFTPSMIYVGIVALALSLTYLLFHLSFTKRLLPNFAISTEYFDWSSIKEIVSSGVWNSVNQLGVFLMFSVSLLLANLVYGAGAAGEYSIVQVVPNFINGIISMLTAVFLPVVIRKYALGDNQGLINEIKNSQKIMGLITNIPIVVFIAVGNQFFTLWVPGENAQRLQLLSILTIAHLMIVGVVWPIWNLNTVMNRVKVPSLLMVLSGLANVLLAMALIKATDLGLYSIPLAMMLTCLIWFGVFIPTYPCSELGVKKTTFYLPVVKTFFGGVIIYFISIAICNVITIDSWLTLIKVCLLCGFVGIVVNSLILFKPSELKEQVFWVRSQLKFK